MIKKILLGTATQAFVMYIGELSLFSFIYALAFLISRFLSSILYSSGSISLFMTLTDFLKVSLRSRKVDLKSDLYTELTLSPMCLIESLF